MMSNLPRPFLSLFLIAVNVAILVLAIYYIYFAEYLSQTSSGNLCLRRSVTSIQWIGVITLTAALLGIIGTWFKLKALQTLYLWALIITTFAAIVYCIFISAVMPKLTAEATYLKAAGGGVWLVAYGPTSQKVLANDKDFFAVKKCFKDTFTCRTMSNQTHDQQNHFVDVGCCIPPSRCGLEKYGTGLWVMPKKGLNSTDDECLMWAKQGESCYECDSCKAAYLAVFQSQWDKNMVPHIISIMVLIVTSGLAYYTLINDQDRGDDNDLMLGRTRV